MVNKYLHLIAMWVIIIGALILFYLAFIWYTRGNSIMGIGMTVMGLIASANFYLHWRTMKKGKI